MNAALDALASKKKPAPTSKERQEHRASCPMVPLAEQYWENVRNLELAAVVQSAQSLASHQLPLDFIAPISCQLLGAGYFKPQIRSRLQVALQIAGVVHAVRADAINLAGLSVGLQD